MEAVTAAKQKRICRSAAYYLLCHGMKQDRHLDLMSWNSGGEYYTSGKCVYVSRLIPKRGRTMELKIKSHTGAMYGRAGEGWSHFSTYPLLEQTKMVRHGFSTRVGGVSEMDVWHDEFKLYPMG